MGERWQTQCQRGGLHGGIDCGAARASLGAGWMFHTRLPVRVAPARYVDAMAESVFLGHRDTLNAEFAKKADSAKVDKLLKTKAKPSSWRPLMLCDASICVGLLEECFLMMLSPFNDARHHGGIGL